MFSSGRKARTGGDLAGIWRGSGGDLAGIWRGSGGDLAGIWRGSGGDLAGNMTAYIDIGQQGFQARLATPKPKPRVPSHWDDPHAYLHGGWYRWIRPGQ